MADDQQDPEIWKQTLGAFLEEIDRARDAGYAAEDHLDGRYIGAVSGWADPDRPCPFPDALLDLKAARRALDEALNAAAAAWERMSHIARQKEEAR
jgi:hypothetical protein